MLAHGDGKKVKLAHLHPNLICKLCGGYLIGATTVTDCLHSFCQSCLLKHLDTKDVCPSCNTKVYKVQPLCNIRQDGLLQDLVYKLVPGLFQNEIQRRLAFLEKQTQSASREVSGKAVVAHSTACNSRGSSESSGNHGNSSECTGTHGNSSLSPSPSVSGPNTVSSPVSVSLLLLDRRPIVDEENYEKDNSLDIRYLLCPEELTVGHLKKFVHLKFTLKSYYQVEFYHKGQRLLEELTLRNVCSLYEWKQYEPLCLCYTVFDPVSVLLRPCSRPTSALSTTSANDTNNSGVVANTHKPRRRSSSDLKNGLTRESVICKQEVDGNCVSGGKCKTGYSDTWSSDARNMTTLKNSEEIFRYKGDRVPVCSNHSRNSRAKNVEKPRKGSIKSSGKASNSVTNCIDEACDLPTKNLGSTDKGQKRTSSPKVAPKIVIRRKRRQEKKSESLLSLLESTPRTHKHVKRSKLAVCKVTENGQVKLIISNQRTESVKRKLLDNNDDSDSDPSCAKSPRQIAGEQSNKEESSTRYNKTSQSLARISNTLTTTTTTASAAGNTDYLSAVAAAGIACITSVPYTSSPTTTTTATTPQATARIVKNVELDQERDQVVGGESKKATSFLPSHVVGPMINQKETSKRSTESFKRMLPTEPTTTTIPGKLCNQTAVSQYPKQLSSVSSVASSETQPKNNDNDTTATASQEKEEVSKHSPQKPSTNSINKDKCIVTPLLKQICIKKSGEEGEEKETKGEIVEGDNLSSFSFSGGVGVAAVKLEKDSSLMTPLHTDESPKPCCSTATSAEQISSSSPSVSPATSSSLHNNSTFSSPLHIKTDLTKTLFERILDEFSPKKEMKETPHGAEAVAVVMVGCEKMEKISSGINNTGGCDDNKTSPAAAAAENTELKNPDDKNDNNKDDCGGNKKHSDISCNKKENNNKVVARRGLFSSLCGVKPSVKSGSEEVKTEEQLDVKSANGSNLFHREGGDSGVVKNNNSQEEDSAAITGRYCGTVLRGSDNNRENLQRTSVDKNDTEGLEKREEKEAFNIVPKPLAAVVVQALDATSERESELKLIKSNCAGEKPILGKDLESGGCKNNEICRDLPIFQKGGQRSRTSLAGKATKCRRALLLSPGNEIVCGEKDGKQPGLALGSQGPLKINVRWDRKERVYVSRSPEEMEMTCSAEVTQSTEPPREEVGVVGIGEAAAEDSSDTGDEEGTLVIDETVEEGQTSSLKTGEESRCKQSCDDNNIKSMGGRRKKVASADRRTGVMDTLSPSSTLPGKLKEASYGREEGEGEEGVYYPPHCADNETRTSATGSTEVELLQIDRVSKFDNGASSSRLYCADNEGINVAREKDLSRPNGPMSLNEGTLSVVDQCLRDKRADNQSHKGTTLPINAATLLDSMMGSAESLGDPSSLAGAASLLNDPHSCHTDSPPHAKIKRISETKGTGSNCHGNLKVVFSLIPKQPKNAPESVVKKPSQKLPDTNGMVEKSGMSKDMSKENSVSENKAEANAVVLKTPSVPKQITANKGQGKRLKRRPFSSVLGLEKSLLLPSCPSVNVTPLGMFASPRVQTISTPCEEVTTPTPTSVSHSKLHPASKVLPPSTAANLLSSFSSPAAAALSYSDTTPLTSQIRSSITLINESLGISECSDHEKNSRVIVSPSSSNNKVLLSVPDYSKLNTTSNKSAHFSSILTVPTSVCIKSEHKKAHHDDSKTLTTTKNGEKLNGIGTTVNDTLAEKKLMNSSAEKCVNAGYKKGHNVGGGQSIGSAAISTSQINSEKNNVISSKHNRTIYRSTENHQNSVEVVDTLCPRSEPSASEQQLKKKPDDIITKTSICSMAANRKDHQYNMVNSVSMEETLTTNGGSQVLPINPSKKMAPVFSPEELIKVPRLFSNTSSSSHTFTQTADTTSSKSSIPFHQPVFTKEESSVSRMDNLSTEKPAKKTAGYMVKPKQLFEAMRSRQLKQNGSENNRPSSVLPFPGRHKRESSEVGSLQKNAVVDSEKAVLLKSNAGEGGKGGALNVSNSQKLNEKTANQEVANGQSKTVNKLRTLTDIGKLAETPEEPPPVSLSRNPPVLLRNAAATPPLMVTPSFYGSPYIPFGSHFAGTYLHPMLPLMMGLERAADELYLQRAPLYEPGHVTSLYDRYYAAHSPPIFPIRCLEEGSSHPSRMEAPLDFSTRGIANSTSNRDVMKKLPSVRESQLDVVKK